MTSCYRLPCHSKVSSNTFGFAGSFCSSQRVAALVLCAPVCSLQAHLKVSWPGNAGGQSVVLTVRRLALGNTVKVRCREQRLDMERSCGCVSSESTVRCRTLLTIVRGLTSLDVRRETVVHFEESCDKNSRRRFECQVSEQFHVGLLLVLVMVLFSALRALSLENFENQFRTCSVWIHLINCFKTSKNFDPFDSGSIGFRPCPSAADVLARESCCRHPKTQTFLHGGVFLVTIGHQPFLLPVAFASSVLGLHQVPLQLWSQWWRPWLERRCPSSCGRLANDLLGKLSNCCICRESDGENCIQILASTPIPLCIWCAIDIARELFDKTHTVVDVETRWANPFVLGQESWGSFKWTQLMGLLECRQQFPTWFWAFAETCWICWICLHYVFWSARISVAIAANCPHIAGSHGHSRPESCAVLCPFVLCSLRSVFTGSLFPSELQGIAVVCCLGYLFLESSLVWCIKCSWHGASTKTWPILAVSPSECTFDDPKKAQNMRSRHWIAPDLPILSYLTWTYITWT